MKTNLVRLALLPAIVGCSQSWASSQQAAQRCPPGAIEIEPEQPIQQAAEKAGKNAVICLKQGIHRLQEVRPLSGQSFYGETGAVLNGAKLLTAFDREGPLWTAEIGMLYQRRHGQCKQGYETCDFPNRLIIDGAFLRRALKRADVRAGWFFFDAEAAKVFFSDDPTGKQVEFSVAPHAFRSKADNVRIHGVTVEKYSTPAQLGAIEGKDGGNWSVEACTVRLNSGAGVSVGERGRITGSDIYRNGQIGAVMVGKDLRLEGNVIWENNRLGFDFTWEAGGVKIAESENVVIARNFAYRNDGPGLWCDINCRHVLFENNRVEYNADAGIFHEISYRAVIRNNVARFNGLARRGWYWGADILIAASENVDVYQNEVTTRDGGSGIMLIDQGRARPDGGTYRTSGNFVHNNVVEFKGDGFMGGASDTAETHQNFSVIETGGNQFDNNVYKVRRQSRVRFVWGHKIWDRTAFQRIGQEPRGRFQIID